VAAPGKIQRPARGTLKTDQREAERVLRLLMTAGLHAVPVPTVEEDAIRDLVRAPEDLRSAIHNVRRTVVRLPASGAGRGRDGTGTPQRQVVAWPRRSRTQDNPQWREQ
jgi:transposase